MFSFKIYKTFTSAALVHIHYSNLRYCLSVCKPVFIQLNQKFTIQLVIVYEEKYYQQGTSPSQIYR
jgi:hypothetical protein